MKKEQKYTISVIFSLIVVVLVFCTVRYFKAGLPENLIADVIDESRVIEYCQYPDFPTGCEAASLYIFLKYYGVEASMEEIVSTIPAEPEPYERSGHLYGGNPERGFVGDPRTDDAYGVYNEPIAETGSIFLDGIKAMSGVTFEKVEELLREGKPLIVWISMEPNKSPKTLNWIDTATGREVNWITDEHAVVAYGITKDGYLVSDPLSGKKKAISRKDFETGLKRYGGRIVLYSVEPDSE